MAAQPTDIVFQFSFHSGQKGRIGRIQTACKHEVLPDHDAFFVAQIIEDIALVDASAPNAEHVHTRFLYGTQQLYVSSVLHSGGKEVLRDVIRPFGEDRTTVELKKE